MVAKIGLTGGIGSGKSTVANCFRRLGIYVVDADQVSRALMQSGTPHYNSIVDHFSPSILLESGEIDRKALGVRVFNNNSERVFLEELLHPAIRKKMHELVEENAGTYGILEVPLLIEGGQHKRMDRVLVVTCPRAMRIERLVKNRNMSIEMIEKVMNTQLTDEQRAMHASEIISNNRPIAETESEVKIIHEKYLAMFGG
ncbi:MAG: dephospho-CoA kinase [Gammaproteobacteria bacterium]|nr:dephospho-CoA kinase [Gammaproteobacteria bacterium]